MFTMSYYGHFVHNNDVSAPSNQLTESQIGWAMGAPLNTATMLCIHKVLKEQGQTRVDVIHNRRTIRKWGKQTQACTS